MRPFEAADVAFLETLKARQETLKAEFTAADRAQGAQHAAKIAAELQEMADKMSAELLTRCPQSFFDSPTGSPRSPKRVRGPGGAGSSDDRAFARRARLFGRPDLRGGRARLYPRRF
jgi:hypothetical protein